jgi:hypothetical protein
VKSILCTNWQASVFFLVACVLLVNTAGCGSKAAVQGPDSVVADSQSDVRDVVVVDGNGTIDNAGLKDAVVDTGKETCVGVEDLVARPTAADFGSVIKGTAHYISIVFSNCSGKLMTVDSIVLDTLYFKLSKVPLTPGQVPTGGTFTIQVEMPPEPIPGGVSSRAVEMVVHYSIGDFSDKVVVPVSGSWHSANENVPCDLGLVLDSWPLISSQESSMISIAVVNDAPGTCEFCSFGVADCKDIDDGSVVCPSPESATQSQYVKVVSIISNQLDNGPCYFMYGFDRSGRVIVGLTELYYQLLPAAGKGGAKLPSHFMLFTSGTERPSGKNFSFPKPRVSETGLTFYPWNIVVLE